MLARSLTTAYSIVGIPLFLLYLSVVGERLARIIGRLTCCCDRQSRRARLRSAYRQKYSDVTLTLQPIRNGHVAQLETNNDEHSDSLKRPPDDNCCAAQVPLFVCAGLLAVFVGVASLVLGLVEPELGFVDSLHLVVNLLLTLGFAGNVLPGMSGEGKAAAASNGQGSLVLLTFVILLGMTLLSSSFNVIMEASRSLSPAGGPSAGPRNTTYHHMPSPSRQIS